MDGVHCPGLHLMSLSSEESPAMQDHWSEPNQAPRDLLEGRKLFKDTGQGLSREILLDIFKVRGCYPLKVFCITNVGYISTHLIYASLKSHFLF